MPDERPGQSEPNRPKGGSTHTSRHGGGWAAAVRDPPLSESCSWPSWPLILPDFDIIDLAGDEAPVNMLVLEELADRADRGMDPLLGIRRQGDPTGLSPAGLHWGSRTRVRPPSFERHDEFPGSENPPCPVSAPPRQLTDTEFADEIEGPALRDLCCLGDHRRRNDRP